MDGQTEISLYVLRLDYKDGNDSHISTYLFKSDALLFTEDSQQKVFEMIRESVLTKGVGKLDSYDISVVCNNIPPNEIKNVSVPYVNFTGSFGDFFRECEQ